MSDDSATQRVVMLDSDHGAYVQLCRRLSALARLPFVLERMDDWHQLQTRINQDEVQAVLSRSANLSLLQDCGVPVIHLVSEPDFSGFNSGLNDSLWEQASASEMVRCLQYAIERHRLRSARKG